MERGLSTLLAALVLILAVSSCLGRQVNDTARNETFILKDVKDNSKVCLRMSAAIWVNITYTTTNETVEKVILPLTNDAEVDYENSTCDMSKAEALLYVRPRGGSDDFGPNPYYILFNFTGSTKKGDEHWAWGNISFGVESDFLDDYDGPVGLQKFTSDEALHGDPNSKIEFERSYTCNSSQKISFPKANNIQAFVNVSQLQVQAFQFRNESSGEFDNTRTCLLDSSGKANKIVPIAVGAALAGLVVVVLIAYLIGRLRSRRQSSYEALS